MDSIGYFDVLPNGRFAYDVKLGFNPKNGKHDYKYSWMNPNVEESLELGNKETKEWHDFSIDISDIPPTVFLLGVINIYSSGYSLYIPLDMSLADFLKAATCEIQKLLSENSEYEKIIVLDILTKGQIDLKDLNSTGQIKSTRKWNEVMKKKGLIWLYETDDGTIKTNRSIQTIVTHCKLFYSKFK
jgi:hypothetical protein